MKYYIYCWIRKDLSIAQQIIQLGHILYIIGYFNYDESIILDTPNICLFEVENENELGLVERNLSIHTSYGYEMFYEEDIKEYTAIATYPIYEQDKIREKFSNYKLYGSQK